MPTVHVMTHDEQREIQALAVRKQTAERMLTEAQAAEGMFWRALRAAHGVSNTVGYSVETRAGIFGLTEDVEAFIAGLPKETPDAS